MIKAFRLTIWVISFLCTNLFFFSCTVKPREVVLEGIFSVKGSFAVGINGKLEDLAGYKFISAADSLQVVSHRITSDSTASSIDLIFKGNDSRLLRIRTLSLGGISAIQAKSLPEMLRLQEGCTCSLDSAGIFYECRIQQPTAIISFYISGFYQQRYTNWEPYLKIAFFVLALLLLALHLRKGFSRDTPTSLMLLLFVAFLPLKWGGVTLSFLIVAAVYTLIKSKARGFKPLPLFYLILGLFVVRLLGLAYTIDLHWGVSRLSQSSSFIVFPLLFALPALAGRSNIEKVLLFFSRSAMLFCAFCLFSLFLYLPVLEIESLKEAFLVAKSIYPHLLVFPSFWHPSFVSIILLMAIAASIYLRFGCVTKRLTTIEMLLCIILVSSFVLLSGARIGLVTIPLLIGVALLFYVKLSRWVKASAALLAIVSVMVVFLKMPAIQQKLDDPIRDQLNATALEAFKERPMLGWGTGSMEKLIKSQALAYKLGYDHTQDVNHFHNAYLDELVQFGVVGSSILFILIGLCIYWAVKRKDFLLQAYLAIYIPFMWVESPFCTSKGMIPMLFWLCFILVTQKERLSFNGKYVNQKEVV